jgi:hypothetical protein
MRIRIRIQIRGTVRTTVFMSTNNACFCLTTILHHAHPGSAIADLLFVQDLDADKFLSGVHIVWANFVKEKNQQPSYDIRVLTRTGA